MPSDFKNIPITIRRRPLFDAMGGAVEPYPLVIGDTIYHWCDPDLAAAWFAYADELLAHPPVHGDGIDESTDVYMRTVLGAICNGINCLNVVWWNIPQVRAAYRKWLSGPPAAVNGNWQDRVFSAQNNYGGAHPPAAGWFNETFEPPVLFNSPLPTGRIPRLARQLFEQYYWPGASPNPALEHPALFIPAVGFGLKVAPGSDFVGLEAPGAGTPDARPLSIELADEVCNDFWYMGENYTTCPIPMSFPQLCEWGVSSSLGRGDAFVRGDGTVGHLSSDGHGYNAFTDFRFGQSWGELNRNVYLPVSPGGAEFLPYLREFVRVLADTNPIDLVQDSRAFVLYQNYWLVNLSHLTLPQYLQQALGVAADAYAAWITPDPIVNTAANLAYAIGAAAATSTAGISAVIGGAVGAVLQIADRMYRHPSNAKKDDIGRLKPVYERAWLSGSQNYGNHDDPLTRPQLNIVDPPGYVRVVALRRDFNADLIAMNLDYRGWLALSRAQRIERAGAMLQGGPYVMPTDHAGQRELSDVVNALDAFSMRAGFRGPRDSVTTERRPDGTPPCDDCSFEEPPETPWGPWIIGGLLVGALWKIFTG